ncbi:MAG TPA: S4 domain-containing protein [Spirochaetota bacterium]|jgi:ribosomal 50S subunit-recycling heat shock protein|nr:MAG: ribosome-associated heat shock protein Hsp15 [Spirochaetes bacterium ADurb.Bin133]HNZ25994.1 S4 domain-containing protein [Spirochaetota bacterium]HOE99842.1 S4 domain-containing protein [Spirochaetota bacterium]HOS31832.1 S4 domain-containing protein [Spirochaetota bacterium]HOS55786.1 S4 domain-containing protein [Spirochaetota bacterium]
MRLDKFLKISLIFKTRSSSDKYFDENKIFINEKVAKPSATVKIGDVLKIFFPESTKTYKIIDIQEKNVSKKEAKKLYEQIGEEKIEIF